MICYVQWFDYEQFHHGDQYDEEKRGKDEAEKKKRPRGINQQSV